MPCYKSVFILFFLLTLVLTSHAQKYDIIPLNKTLGLINDKVQGIEKDDQGRLFIMVNDTLIRYLDNDLISTAPSNIKMVKPSQGRSYKEVTKFVSQNPSITITNATRIDSRTWIGTKHHGIYIIDHNASVINLLNNKNGLKSNWITRIVQDKWKRIFITTNDGAIFRIKDNLFYAIDPHFDAHVTSMALDQLGRTWIGTDHQGLFLLNNSVYQHIPYITSSDYSSIDIIHADQKNRVWIGTSQDGLILYDDQGRIVQINDPALLTSQSIADIVYDQGERVWIATRDQGIILLQEDGVTFYKLRSFDESNGLPENQITSLYWSKDRLWFTTANHGAGWIDLINYKINLLEHQKYSLSKLTYKVMSIKDKLIIGTDQALHIIEKNSDKSVILANPQNTQSTFRADFAIDSFDQLWRTTSHGVERIQINNDPPNITYYTRTEGLPHEAASKILVTDNFVQVGTATGVYLGESIFKHQYITPEVEISDIKLFYQSLPKSTQQILTSPNMSLHKFNYDQDHFGFSFDPIHGKYEEDVLFRYRLNKANPWSPPSRIKEVNFAHIAPGHVLFEIQAIHPRQPELKSTIKNVQFLITTPLWQKSWFPIIPTLILGGLLFYLYKVRIHQLNEKGRQDKLKLVVQNKLLDLERSALQLQMNPHFIFNVLNTVKKELRQNDIATSERILTRFSTLMRNTLEHSRKAHIFLEDEIQRLDDYLSIEQSSRKPAFKYNITHDVEDIYDVEVPPMMLQPFVENAILHGIARISDGQIDIHFTQKGKLINCKIIDNGPGYKPQQNKMHKSRAIQITKDRLSLLSDTRKEHIYIDNRLDKNGSIIGTQVEVWLPIASNY